MIKCFQHIKMSGIYARFKSYAVRSGPYLYDYRFLIAGFCITGYGVIKIVNASRNKSKLLREFPNASLEDLFGHDIRDVVSRGITGGFGQGALLRRLRRRGSAPIFAV